MQDDAAYSFSQDHRVRAMQEQINTLAAEVRRQREHLAALRKFACLALAAFQYGPKSHVRELAISSGLLDSEGRSTGALGE
jgi:hypothetical protein